MELHRDLFQGYSHDLFGDLPLQLFARFLDGESFDEMSQYINDRLAANEWNELKIVMMATEVPPFSENIEFLDKFFNGIVIPQKHWKSLQRGKSEQSLFVLDIIESIAIHADKNVAVKNLSKFSGIEILCNIIMDQSRSDGEKICCLNAIKAILLRTEDVELIRPILPLVKHIFTIMKQPKANCGIVHLGIDVVHAACCCRNSTSLMIEILSSLSSEVVHFLASAFKRGQEQKGSQIENGLYTWTAAMKTISMILKKAKSVKISKDNLLNLTKTVVKIINSSIAITSVELNQSKFSCVEAAVVVIALLMDEDDRAKDMNVTRGSRVVRAIIEGILFVCNNSKIRNRCFKYDMMGNSFLIIGKMIEKNIGIDIKLLAPAFSALSTFFAVTVCPEHYASDFAVVCLGAVDKGSKDDVKHLLSQQMMPLLAILYNVNSKSKMLGVLLSTLYKVILKVPDTDQFYHFKDKLFTALLYRYWDPVICDFDTDDAEIGNMCAYVLTAIGINCHYTDEKRFQILQRYFHHKYEIIETGKIPIKAPYPGSFLVKKMVNVSCFKSNVLPHIWYVAETGPNELVSALFESISEAEVPTSTKDVTTLKEMKEQVLKFVLIEIKAIIELKSQQEDSTIITITQFLTSIPCNEQGDTVLYHLEDLVSPCLGLLEDQNNKRIIENVKKFIKNLHCW